MKTNILYKVLMLAMMTVVTMTFTACGGDSDDDDIIPPVKSNYIYVEPYLEWGSLRTDVKSYMTGTEWKLSTDAAYLLYVNANKTIEQKYVFFSNASINETEGLISIQIKYENYTEDYWKWLVKETEKRYGVKFTIEETDSTTGGDSVTTIIKDKQVTVTVTKYAGLMFITFNLNK